MSFARTVFDLFRETFQEWSEDNAARMAAALAYYTVFSIGPLLVIVTAVAGLAFGQDAVRDRLDEQIAGLVGPESAAFIQEIIKNASDPGEGLLATVIGIATLLLGAMGVFQQLQDALNTAWDVSSQSGGGLLVMIRSRLISFGMVLVVGLLLLISLVLSAALAALNNLVSGFIPQLQLLAHILNFVVSFGIITLLFALIYKYLPETDIAWRDVWVGSALTALLFTVGKQLIGLYLGNSGLSSTYGAAGSFVVILVWIYYSAQILLFGAEFTQVFARRFGSRRAGALRHPLSVTA
ncbi:MAG TPA: YihY/virulence factor BrkB family protein [Spirillospora sp.]|nr:YihY/virulence factor BrkB family protein [Spirillospora sp.]